MKSLTRTAVRELVKQRSPPGTTRAGENPRDELLKRSCPMGEVLYYAIPFFVLLLIAEYVTFRHLGDDDDDYAATTSRTAARRSRWASGTSSSTSSGSSWWSRSTRRCTSDAAAAGPAQPADVDRAVLRRRLRVLLVPPVSHESRVFWASHAVHHSSQHFNLSTALRQTWVPMTYFPFWLPLPLLGFPVWMILLAQAWSLIYQFWIHTERITRSRGRSNTSSTRRAITACTTGEPPVPGQELRRHPDHLGPHVRDLRARAGAGAVRADDAATTHHPVRVAFHEYVALAHDVGATKGVGTKLKLLLKGPGWKPPGPDEHARVVGATRG